MISEAGQRFGPYEILAKLGSGGMGVVYRAWDERLHREVAVKLLYDQYQAPGMRERFLLEARAASALAHPHICTIFDIGQQDGEPYLVMELLEGMTLRDKIAQAACSSEEIVRYSEEISDALAAAHAKGIVHRDIKPANVFLQGRAGAESQVKVLDFGLAKVSLALRSGRASRALEITSAGSTVGTLAYMSPEQARGEALDLRSDLFSLGVVMYEMATRRTPFRGATTALVFQALLTQAPDPIRTWNVTVPRELERVIMRLLAKDRFQRFQSAAEVQEVLRKLESRGDGDWLKRIPRAAIPLVPAVDPIARRNRTRRSETIDVVPRLLDPGSTPLPATKEPPVEDSQILRPRRLPRRENRPRESSFASRLELARSHEMTQLQESTSPFPIDSADNNNFATGGSAKDHVFTSDSSPADNSSEPSTEPLSSSASSLAAPEPTASAHPSSSTTSLEQIAVSGSETTLRETGGSAIVANEQSADSRISDPTFEVAPKRSPETKKSIPGSSNPGLSPTLAPINTSSEIANKTVRAGRSKRSTWFFVGGGSVLLVLALLFFAFRSGSLSEVVLAPTDTILIAPLTNRSGDASLNDAVSEGLELELEQRSRLHWLGMSALRAGVHRVAAQDHLVQADIPMRSIAQTLGARAYIYGEISKKEQGFLLRVYIVDAASNDRLGSVTETAENETQLSAAITQLAIGLRQKLGDTETGSAQTSETPLSLQATGNMAALEAYAKGEAARADGNLSAAASLYEQASSFAPDFALPQLRLAWIYDRVGAELAAGQSAARALALAHRAGDRVEPLARIADALLSKQDPLQAAETARQLAAKRPDDQEALILLAHVMRVQGHMTEALLSAEQAYHRHPFSGDSYDEAALALIGLDRYDTALSLAATAAKSGVHCECGVTAAQYLSGAKFVPDSQDAQPDLKVLEDRAFELDDAGQLTAGLALWRAAVESVRPQVQLVSAAAIMLSSAAVDRALVSRCAQALPLAHEASLIAYGRRAAFQIALTNALCLSNTTGSTKDEAESRLVEGAGLHSLSRTLFAPTVAAARDLQSRQPMRALASTSGFVDQRDVLPTAVYLRGLARQAEGENGIAATDLESVARRRGYAFLSHATVAPLADYHLEFSLRSAGHIKEANNAGAAFQRLWAESDPGLISSLSR